MRFLTKMFIICMFLSSCFKEDPIIAISKCNKAADILGDGELHRATELRMSKMNQPEFFDARLAMEYGEKIRDLIQPAGSSTSMVYMLKTATQWKESSFCEDVRSEYKNQVKAALEEVIASGSAKNCSEFISQLRWIANPDSEKYRQKIITLLQQSLTNTITEVPDYKRDHINSRIKTNLTKFGQEIQAECTSAQPSLAAAINSVQSVRAVKSPRTLELTASESRFMQRNTQQWDCGDLEVAYCKEKLMAEATPAARVLSISCDQEAVPSLPECALTSNQMVEVQFRQLAIVHMTKLKTELEVYLADPHTHDFNLDAKLKSQVEICGREAISRGIRDGAFFEYLEATCKPVALEEYLAPRRQLLLDVNVRLKEFAK